MVSATHVHFTHREFVNATFQWCRTSLVPLELLRVPIRQTSLNTCPSSRMHTIGFPEIAAVHHSRSGIVELRSNHKTASAKYTLFVADDAVTLQVMQWRVILLMGVWSPWSESTPPPRKRLWLCFLPQPLTQSTRLRTARNLCAASSQVTMGCRVTCPWRTYVHWPRTAPSVFRTTQLCFGQVSASD